jgi:two-component system, cell cycle response regulator
MAVQLSSAKQLGKEFVIAVVGVADADIKIISRIFSITRYRQRRYKLLPITEVSAGEVLDAAKNADIHIVNVHSPIAVRFWKNFASSVRVENRKPAIKLSKLTPSSEVGAELTISWPINPAKMLQVLDNYTIRHLHYYPEFEIGLDVHPSTSTVKNVKALGAQLQAVDVNVDTATRVLIADDSLAVRRQLKIGFDFMNANLNLVADGEAAVKAAEEHQYDIIFLDVVMPGIDGYSVCKNIRRSRLNKKTPVVMLTSRSSSFDKLKGVLAGCDTYLTKPINHNDFKEITQKHLNKNMEKN